MRSTISFPNLGLSFEINRAAFSIGGIEIYWYGLIIAAGMALAIIYGMREFKRCGLKQDDLFNMFIICLPVAIVCARLYYVAFSFDEFKDNLLSIFDIRSGGLAVYGSLIGVILVIVIYCLKKKINLRLVLDILAVGFLIGQSIGRWGNFVNAEAYGSTTTLPWAMTIVTRGLTRASSVHPTFLYESLWDAAGVVILLIYRKKKAFSGEVFLGYLLWYGLGRFWIEGLRADSLYLGSVRISQLVAALSVIFGLAGIIAGRIMKSKNVTIVSSRTKTAVVTDSAVTAAEPDENTPAAAAEAGSIEEDLDKDNDADEDKPFEDNNQEAGRIE